MTATKRSLVMGLVNDLFNTAMEVQELYLRNGPYQDLSLSEMHVLEAVSLEDKATMTNVAKRLMVTVGTLTTSVTRIVEKGYLVREKSLKDRRVCLLKLTEEGQKALNVHNEFHQQLEKMILKPFRNDDYDWVIDRLQEVLQSLEAERMAYYQKNTAKERCS